MTSTRIIVYTVKGHVGLSGVARTPVCYYYSGGTLYYTSWYDPPEYQPDYDTALAKLKLLEILYGHEKGDLMKQARRLGGFI